MDLIGLFLKASINVLNQSLDIEQRMLEALTE